MQSIHLSLKKKSRQYKVLSPLEKNIVDVLLKYKNLDFHSNYSVGPFQVDIAFPKHKVGLEIDGYEYHSSEEQRTRDKLRQEYLEEVEGWRIERIAGWFCYRYPEITVAKVLRHIPEIQDHPMYKNACIAAKQWLGRDLLNDGYKEKALIIFTDLSK